MSDVSLSAMDRVRPPTRVRKSVLVKIGIALLSAAVLVFTVLSRLYSDTVEVAHDRISVAEVQSTLFGESMPISGRVVPIDTIYLDAVEGGQVIKRHVDEGALVKEGDLLVSLKNTNLQLEIIGREAQVTEQLNSLMMTELSLEQNRLKHRRDLIELDEKIEATADRLARLRGLEGAGAVSEDLMHALEREYRYAKSLREATAEAQEVDLRSQKSQVSKIQAAIGSMNENLAIARDNLKSLQVLAPISGQLTMLKANSGESLAKGQRFGQIDELDSFRISALVDEFYLSKLVIGQVGQIDLEGVTYPVSVSKIYPEVQARQFRIDLDFAQKPPSLRLGQTLTGHLEVTRPKRAMTIQYGPFYESSDGSAVFVMNAAGDLAVRRASKLGRRNGDKVEVLSGLAKGERVIVSDYRPFGSSDQVRVKQP